MNEYIYVATEGTGFPGLSNGGVTVIDGGNNTVLWDIITALIGLMYSTYAGFNGVVNTVMLNSYNGTLMQPSTIVPYWEAALTALLWTIALTSIGAKIVTSIRYAPPEEIREF